MCLCEAGQELCALVLGEENRGSAAVDRSGARALVAAIRGCALDHGGSAASGG